MSASAGAWCVQVEVDRADTDPASGRLWAGGAHSVHEVELDKDRVRLVAGVPADVVERLSGSVADLAPVTYEAAYDGWIDAWRPFARPVRVGRVLVHPAWEEADAVGDARAGDVVVAIDAQRAFGQGNHATTRLVVAALDHCVTPRTTLLDVGCGSGILSVVAARLGAPAVTAVDLDDQAVAATRANAMRNDVASRIDVSDTPVGQVPGSFDVVVANILASTLIELAPAIVARTGPAGMLVLSGLTVAQRARVLDAYRPLEIVTETRLDDWLCLTLTLTPPP